MARLPNGMTAEITDRTDEPSPYLDALRAAYYEALLGSPDAMRLDASRAEADAELVEWRALVEGMKGRRRG